MKHIQSFLSLAIATALSVILMTGLWPHVSLAHWDDLSTAEIVISDSTVTLTVAIPKGQLEQMKQASTSLDFKALIQNNLTLKNNDQRPQRVDILPLNDPSIPRIQGNQSDQRLPQDQHLAFQIQSEWPSPIQTLSIDYQVFPADAPTSKLITTITQLGTQGIEGDRPIIQHVFTPSHPIFEFEATEFEATDPQASSVNYFALGWAHILTGYDHLAFLVALVIGAVTLRLAIQRFMLFSLSYTCALCLTAIHVISWPTAWVESAIAGSILLMVLLSLHPRGAKLLTPLIVLAGWVHGIGLATLFNTLQFSLGQLWVPLVQYLSGVELGQILMFGGFSVLGLGRKRYLAALELNTLILMGVALVGGYWLLERLSLAL